MLEAARDGERLMLAHRIDRETSGVLLLSRTPEADRHVKAQFARGAEEDPKGGPQARSVRKRYIAITWGWPEIDTFRVDLPLELDPTSRYGVKMRVARPGRGPARRDDLRDGAAEGFTRRPAAATPSSAARSRPGGSTRSACTWRALGLPLVGR
jgi:hypothetical protein